MDRWIGVFRWLAVVGLVLLVVVGVVVWLTNPASLEPLVVTPTLASAAPTSMVTEPSPSATPPPETPTPVPTWTPTPTATPTPRPSPTLTLTPTPTATPSPETLVLPGRATLPAIANTPVVTSPLPQPSPMPLVEQPDGTINILLLGMDRNAGEGTARTDVMMIASVFPDVPAVSLLSIPRDYYAWIPAWGLDKINTTYPRASKVAYPGGGPALTMATVEYNFGVPIHYYALVDFTSYRRIVDAVGGVDIVVECPLHDTYPDPESPIGQTDIDLDPGVHHLDGKFALWYVRSRWSTSDFDRHRRQQQVLLAILRQARSQNMLVRVPELWDAYRDSVETDLGLKELLTLATVAGRLDERNITTSFIRGADVITSWTAPNGGYVLVPNQEAVLKLLQGAMQPLSANRAAQQAYRVVVSNGSWSSAFGEVAAYRLGLEGLQVTEIQTVEAQPRTRVIDFTTTAKGSPLYRLISLYRLQQGDVVKEPVENREVDFQVILGTNYNPCTGTGTAYWRSTPTPIPPP
ncbi:MAG: LCP family protein [Anaerolineae bacterium]|nr:LCP family protein [Anaerolineae bacterium]